MKKVKGLVFFQEERIDRQMYEKSKRNGKSNNNRDEEMFGAHVI